MWTIQSKIKPVVTAIAFCIVFTALFVALSFLHVFFPAKYERFTHGILGTVAACISTYIFLKLHKKKFRDIGLYAEPGTLLRFLIGFAAGIILMGSLVLFVILVPGFIIERNPGSNALYFFLWSLSFIPLAFMEELGFRAFPLRIIHESVGPRAAILVTSLLFALYHIVNGWTIEAAFLGTGVWGIIFAVSALYSKGIALPAGMHYAVNLVPALFSGKNNSWGIWTLRQGDGSSLENYVANPMIDLIPKLFLLIVAVLAMEWYVRKRVARSQFIS